VKNAAHVPLYGFSAFQGSIGAQGAIYVTAKHGLIGLAKVVAKGPSKFKISTFSLYDLTLSARLR
jgi:hypothetical protein